MKFKFKIYQTEVSSIQFYYNMSRSEVARFELLYIIKSIMLSFWKLSICRIQKTKHNILIQKRNRKHTRKAQYLTNSNCGFLSFLPLIHFQNRVLFDWCLPNHSVHCGLIFLYRGVKSIIFSFIFFTQTIIRPHSMYLVHIKFHIILHCYWTTDHKVLYIEE